MLRWLSAAIPLLASPPLPPPTPPSAPLFVPPCRLNGTLLPTTPLRCGPGQFVGTSPPDPRYLVAPNQTLVGGLGSLAMQWYFTSNNTQPVPSDMGIAVVGRPSTGSVMGAVVATTLSASGAFMYVDLLSFRDVGSPDVVHEVSLNGSATDDSGDDDPVGWTPYSVAASCPSGNASAASFVLEVGTVSLSLRLSLPGTACHCLYLFLFVHTCALVFGDVVNFLVGGIAPH